MREVDRRMLSLALPTLGALLAPPLFVLVDTAMVGHLGTDELAGMAIGSTLLTTVVGLLVFLAYATTASVARTIGAGDRARALRLGVDGMWFAGLLGVIAAASLMVFAAPLTGLFGGSGGFAVFSVDYLLAAAPGVVGMLITYAATGTLRGFSRVRIVLGVAVAAAIANAGLNAVLIYGLGLGVFGSGLGTAIAETLMAGVLAGAVIKQARAEGVVLRPSWVGVAGVGRDGWPLFVRTLSLRVALVVTVWAASRLGAAAVSANQIVLALWYLAAYALDAIAIAAQTLIGEALGGGLAEHARMLVRRCVRWGVWFGVLVGVVLVAGAAWLPWGFTSDSIVRSMASWALVVAAAAMPVAGVVYVLDGVLIGAGDGRYLAWTGVANLLTYLPFVVAVGLLAPAAGLVWLWLAYCISYMGSRCATLSWRAASSSWMKMGAGS